MPHCGSVLPICLSLRPVGSINISCLAARQQTSAAQIAKASPPYNMKYFNSFFWHYVRYLSVLFFNFYLTEAPPPTVRVLVPSYRSPRHWQSAGHAAFDRYILAAGSTAANPPQRMMGRTDRQTDRRRMRDSFIDPAPNTTPARQ